MTPKLLVHYDIRSTAAAIEDRARTIAIEQSVEMPVAAIDDERVRAEILGRVVAVEDQGGGIFRATIALDLDTTGFEAGQLLNILFGNASILDDVTLAAITVPQPLAQAFPGPRHGPDGLRARVEAGRRALTCTALKPQGLPPERLAALAYRLALGGLDYIKDDHNLADQRHAPFAARVAAIAAAVAGARTETGRKTRYLPSLSGNLDSLRRQTGIVRDNGLDTVLIAPMIVGLPAFETIVRESPDLAFIAHPAMAGAARISPAALLGTLFRMLGADGIVFPNLGGRFGYSEKTCRALADAARAPLHGHKPTLPVPAGGMTLARVPELLSFYGTDAMLLVGGDLLLAHERMTDTARVFQGAVELAACPAAQPSRTSPVSQRST